MNLSVLNNDITHTVRELYKSIDQRYKTAFCISLVCTILTFFIFFTQYLLHNHGLRLPWVDPYEQFGFGRWFTVVFFKLFYNADIPVFTPLAASIMNVITGLLVATMWTQGKKLSTTRLTCITLLISLYPAMLSAYYFTVTTEMFIGGIFLSTLALYFASSLHLWRVIVGTVFIMFAMATYQPCLSVFATIFMGLFVLHVADHKGNVKSFLLVCKTTLLPKFLSIILGGIFYRVSLTLLGINVGGSHATKTVSFVDIPTRFVQVCRESFAALWYTQPELLSPLKEILLTSAILAALLLIYVAVRNSSTLLMRTIKIIALLLSIIGLVIATKAMFIVSSDIGYWQYRYNFSLGFLYAFTFFVLLSYCKKPWLKNIAFLLCLFVIMRYGQADLVRQGVLLRGQQHDLALANRILYRIESLPSIDFSKKYYLVRTGPYPRIRMKSFRSKGHSYDRGGSGHLDRGEITDIWCPADVMSLLGSKISWMGKGYMPDFRKKMEIARDIAKKQGRKPWPHKSSVFIHKDWVIVNM